MSESCAVDCDHTVFKWSESGALRDGESMTGKPKGDFAQEVVLACTGGGVSRVEVGDGDVC